MSYILDALRKSELQRGQGATPAKPLELQLASEPGARPASPRFLRPAVLAVMVIALAGWWFGAGHRQQDTSFLASRLATPGVDPSEPPAPRSTPEVAAAPTGPGPEEKSQPAAPKTRDDVARVPAAKTFAEPAQAAVDTNVSAPAAKTTALADVPPDVRQVILSEAIAMHRYSENAPERMVVINGRIAHEGDELASGLRLDAVTPDGVVFDFKGYRVPRSLH